MVALYIFNYCEYKWLRAIKQLITLLSSAAAWLFLCCDKIGQQIYCRLTFRFKKDRTPGQIWWGEKKKDIYVFICVKVINSMLRRFTWDQRLDSSVSRSQLAQAQRSRSSYVRTLSEQHVYYCLKNKLNVKPAFWHVGSEVGLKQWFQGIKWS